MASEVTEKLRENWTQFNEWLNEQVWFQELKQKWEELDPQSRLYAKAASLGAALLLLVVFSISSIWGVYKIKHEYNDKSDLLSLIQSSSDELRRLKEANAQAASAGEAAGPWSGYVESVAASAGIDKTSLEVGAEKPGTATDSSKEALLDVALKHVSIKQVVRMAFQLENGTRPLKLRGVAIDTKSDPMGYMDATLSLSGFTLVTK